MKRVLYILLSFVLAQGFVACETVDFGDINENQNGTKEAYPAGLLAGSIQSFSTMTGRSGVMNPTLYVQYQSQVTYTDEMLYAEAPESWATYYNVLLPNLNKIIEVNSNEENHTPSLEAQGAPVNQTGVAMIFRAVVLKRLTDNWGAVPFSKAVQGLESLTPEYDSQEQIYTQIINDLKAGRDMINVAKAAPIGDILYNGNLSNWKKLANSLLLQATMQLSEVDATSTIDAKGEFAAALAHPAGVIDEMSEEAWFRYEAVTAFQNPFNRNRKADYFLSGEFVNAFQGDAALNPTSNRTYDARLEVFATDATAEGVPYGYNDETGAGRSQLSKYIWAATVPLPLMTASYTYLNRAEAAARGWTTESAATMLEKGIEMSFTTWGARSEKDIAAKGKTYAAARLAQVASVGMLQVIGEEKWKALFPQGFDAWAEWRRTGIPNLIPATDAINDGKIATRYMYPVEEATLNRVSLDGGIKGLNPATDRNTSKVWWDK
jgi:hypothetical protein